MQNPSPPVLPDSDLFYDVDEAGNLVRRSPSARTSSNASRPGLGDDSSSYDSLGRLVLHRRADGTTFNYTWHDQGDPTPTDAPETRSPDGDSHV